MCILSFSCSFEIMGRPENGIYIIQGEVNLVVTAMRRNSRWSSHAHQDDEQDPLINSFSQLKDVLNTISGVVCCLINK